MSGVQSKGASNDSFASYPEYLRFLASQNDYYRWLADYFGSTDPAYTNGSYCEVYDSDAKGIRKTETSPYHLLDVPNDLKTRIVIFVYTNVWELDRRLLAQLAFILNLEPSFLWEHLDGAFREQWTKGVTGIGTAFPFSTGGTRMAKKGVGDCDEIQLRPYSMSASMRVLKRISESQANLVFLMINDDPSMEFPFVDVYREVGPQTASKDMPVRGSGWNTIGGHYLGELQSLTQEDCAEMDNNPINYMIPYFRLLLFYMGYDVHRAFVADHNEGKDELVMQPPQNPKNLKELRTLFAETNQPKKIAAAFSGIGFTIVNSKETLRAINMILEYPFQKENQDLMQVKYEYEMGLQELSNLMEKFRNTDSLLITAKSVEQAESSKRISQLAYIYLPLAFGSSVFGMNVPQLRDAHLAAYIVTSIVLIVLSLLLWWSFNSIGLLLGHIMEIFKLYTHKLTVQRRWGREQPAAKV